MDLISEENYIIAQAKQAVRTDPFAAKAWIITAKTLFPNNFGVQVSNVYIEEGSSLKTTVFLLSLKLTKLKKVHRIMKKRLNVLVICKCL